MESGGTDASWACAQTASASDAAHDSPRVRHWRRVRLMLRWLEDWTKGHAPAATERARRALAAHAWPAPLLDVLGRLREGGRRAVLVGGAVRDAALGRASEPTFDVATDLL